MPILNVDDHAPARFLRSRVLRAHGFEVLESDSATSAVQMAVAPTRRPRLVLLDVGLPDGSGIDACAEIKAHSPTTPVVLISAVYRTSDARRDGFAAGADAYLIEPVSPESLIRTVRELTSADAPVSSHRPAMLRTTAVGEIVMVNGPAAHLLNLVRVGVGRSILPFFDGERSQVQAAMAAAASGRIAQLAPVRWRPRERKPFQVAVDISRTDAAGPIELEWVFDVVESQPGGCRETANSR